MNGWGQMLNVLKSFKCLAFFHFRVTRSNFCLKDNASCFCPYSMCMTDFLPPRHRLVTVHVSMIGKYTCTGLNQGWQTVGTVINHTEHWGFFGQSYTIAAEWNNTIRNCFEKSPCWCNSRTLDIWHVTRLMTFEIRQGLILKFWHM